MAYDNKRLAMHVLATGSKGNATIIQYGETNILVDAGISAKRIREELQCINLSLNDLTAIFISHEHVDHMKGLAQLNKHLSVPIYTKRETWRAMEKKVALNETSFVSMDKAVLDVGELTIESFPLSHDAANPIGFSVYGGHEKATIVTDTGLISDAMIGHMDESTMLLLESNHDLDMLTYGPYALSLKERVGGPKGHLSNDVAISSLLRIKRAPNLHVVLGHRSEQNNMVSKVDKVIQHVLCREGIRLDTDITIVHGNQDACVSIEKVE